MQKKASKISLGTLTLTQPKVEAPLRLEDTRGVVKHVSVESETVAFRLAGHWLKLWNMLKASEKSIAPSDILRQALALRAALSAVDADGNRPKAFIKYKNEAGEMVTEPLEKHIGM
jgi:hypothetical protein